MTYPAPLLPHLLVGWQKVADQYNMPIYVFQTGRTYQAVSNEAQGVGRLVDTLTPRLPVPAPKACVVTARPMGGERLFAGAGNDG